MFNAKVWAIFSESGDKFCLYPFKDIYRLQHLVVYLHVSHMLKTAVAPGNNFTGDMKDIIDFILNIFNVFLFEHLYSNLKAAIKEYVRSSAKAS